MQNCVYVEMLFVTKGSFFLLCKERTLEEEAWEESKHLKQNRALEMPPLSISLPQVLQSFTVAFNHVIVPPLKITVKPFLGE